MKPVSLQSHESPTLCLDISEQVLEELIVSGKLVVEQIRGHNESSKRRLKEILKIATSHAISK